MIHRLGRLGRCISALLGLGSALGGCRPRSAAEAPRPGWSLLVAAPDTVLLDTAGIEWTSSDARVWLRMQRPKPIGSIVAVETHHDVSCDRREIRDLEIRGVGVTGDVVQDSVIQAPAWISVSARPAVQGALPMLCARLSQLNPRGLHSLLGSDRP